MSGEKGKTTNHPYNVLVRTPLGEFPSISSAGRAHDVKQSTIMHRCKQGDRQRLGEKLETKTDYTGYVILRTVPIRERGRGVITPHGAFAKVCYAAAFEKVTPAAIIHKIKSNRDGYRYK
jgi:hypothetical protein